MSVSVLFTTWTLKNTIECLISSSTQGYTASELTRILNVKVEDVLLELVTTNIITRKKLSGMYVYYTTVTGRWGEKTHILAVLKDHQKKTVKAFLDSIPLRLRRTIKAVCSDMYDGFVNAVKEVFGSHVLIIDRFHVAKGYRGAVDTLRKQELKRLKKALPEEEFRQLNGVMWLLRKKAET
ncbi:MAG: transposase [bacterium]|nr:transposase [bacterium]